MKFLWYIAMIEQAVYVGAIYGRSYFDFETLAAGYWTLYGYQNIRFAQRDLHLERRQVLSLVCTSFFALFSSAPRAVQNKTTFSLQRGTLSVANLHLELV